MRICKVDIWTASAQEFPRMRLFYFKIGVAAFIGKLVGALFIAVCFLLGFGPDRWAEFIVSGLDISPQAAQIAFVGLGLITLFALGFSLIGNKLAFTHEHRLQDKQDLERLRLSGQSKKITRDVWLQDAVCFALHGRWLAQDEPGFPDGSLNRVGGILHRMRELAGEGGLTIWGKSDQNRLHEKIPQDFWTDNQIAILQIVGGAPEQAKTESATWRQTSKKYEALMTSKAQIEELWPATNVGA